MISHFKYIYFNFIWVVPQKIRTKNNNQQQENPPETACEFVDLCNLRKSTTYNISI